MTETTAPVAQFKNPEHGQPVTEYAVMASLDGVTWSLAPLSRWLGQEYDPVTTVGALATSLAVRCRERLVEEAERYRALARQATHLGDDYSASLHREQAEKFARHRVAVFVRQTTPFTLAEG